MFMMITKLYQAVADLTLGHCKRTCLKLGSCCSPEYCEMAIQFAHDMYQTDLVRTNNYHSLMNDDGGCTAAPHLRPLCARHSCDINSLGFFKGEPELTSVYFKLTDRLSELEAELYAKDLE